MNIFYCPSKNSHRPRSQNISKESTLNPEKDSSIKRPSIIEYKQKVSDVSLPYNGSALKKCARFPEGVAEIRQPSKYRIIMFENLWK